MQIKNFSITLLCTFIGTHFTPSFADVPKNIAKDEGQDVVSQIDRLIFATESSLQRQKKIRALLLQYKEVETLAIKDPNNSDNLMKLVGLAKQLQDSIKENHLQDYFPPQFMEEISKLAHVAEKKTILPPK
jgi:hypothetical protein